MRAESTDGRRAPSDLRLALLVLEGYVWLLGVVAAFAAVVAFLAWGLVARRPLIALVALFVGVPSAMLALASIRVLFFRLPTPRGIRLSRAEAPALYALADDVARALDVRPVAGVVVNAAFNASLAPAPGLAFGRGRGVLVLGLPALATLNAEQLRAVVAHELAHLGHSHGRLAAWVYRMRRTWLQLVTTVDARGAMPIFVRWPFAHYVPRLDALSAATSRRQELLADRVAAAHAGARATAETLVLMDMGAALLERRVWPELHAASQDDPEPPHPFARVAATGVRVDDASEESLLREHLEEETWDGDSHPCLADRLRALGQPALRPPPAAPSVGEALLGDGFAALAARLDAQWREAQRPAWEKRHAYHADARARLAALEADPSPTADVWFARAELVETLRGPEAAIPVFRAALDVDPTHARAELALGRLLLETGDDAGAAHVERAIARDPRLCDDGGALLADFHEERGDVAAALRWRARAEEAEARARTGARERETVSALDRFVPHAVDDAALAALRGALAHEPEVREAYLAARVLFHSDGRPLVLGLAGPGADAVRDRVRAAGGLPPDAAVVLLGREQRALREALAAVPNSALIG